MMFGKHAGGDSTYAYKPVPYFFTSYNRSLVLENNDYSLFDMTRKNIMSIKVCNLDVAGRIMYGQNPLELLQQYTTYYCGRMKPLPEWVLDGVIAGIQGGEGKVMRIVDESVRADIPLAGLWYVSFSLF
jgi:hypothetical protein